MQVPKRRLEIAKTYNARSSNAGWLVIDVRGLELEGVTKLYVDLDEVHSLKAKREQAIPGFEDLFGEGDENDLI